MHKGSCFCGAVQYEIKGELGPITLCHCSRCRKANGTAFWAAASVGADQFHLVSGCEALTEFESSLGVHRIFCGLCGSRLFGRCISRNQDSATIRVCIGTLDTPVPTRPVAHIFVSQKAAWFDIQDDLPQFLEGPEWD